MRDVEGMPALIESFLQEQTGRAVSVTSYQLLTGGYSRVMARAECAWDDGRRETFVLRGDPPPDQAMLETDRDAEWALLRALTDLDAVPMPAARFYDGTAGHLGTKCIVLDCVPGPSLHTVLATADDPAIYRDAFVDAAAAIHAIDVDRLPDCLARPGSWDDYLTAANAQWAAFESTLADANPVMRYVGAWLDANRPPPMPLTLCHGDFQDSNILVDGDSFQVIDWEYAHVGDPREDLGWYVIYSQSSPPSLYALDPEAFLARYRDRTGADEAHVNQATVGYFAVVAASRIFGQLMQAASAMYAGTASSVMTAYNINAIAIGHQNFLAACAGLAEPLATLRDAALV